MRFVAITERVSVIPAYNERRDCLDQAWAKFLLACGLLPLVPPNVPKVALALCKQLRVTGLVLTGGALAATSGPLVITYDRNWRRLWSRHFANPLADAETFRVHTAGRLLEIGAKTSKVSTGNTWVS